MQWHTNEAYGHQWNPFSTRTTSNDNAYYVMNWREQKKNEGELSPFFAWFYSNYCPRWLNFPFIKLKTPRIRTKLHLEPLELEPNFIFFPTQSCWMKFAVVVLTHWVYRIHNRLKKFANFKLENALKQCLILAIDGNHCCDEIHNDETHNVTHTHAVSGVKIFQNDYKLSLNGC